MTQCCTCKSAAVKKFTWINSLGVGLGNGAQGGPMCEACMTYHHSKLSNEIGKSVHRLLRDGHSARITPAITP